MNDGLQAKESTRNGTEPPSRDTSHRTLPHPKPSGSKALEPRSAVASKGSETGIRLRLESLDASRRSPTRPQEISFITSCHSCRRFKCCGTLIHPCMISNPALRSPPALPSNRSPFTQLSLHTDRSAKSPHRRAAMPRHPYVKPPHQRVNLDVPSTFASPERSSTRALPRRSSCRQKD